MVYVALLRGINVGGNTRVEMARLKALFNKLGFTNVRTYINSGNVVFRVEKEETSQKLAKIITSAIKNEFGLTVPVLVYDAQSLKHICQAIPDSWTNDTKMKSDVIFLWQEVDSPDVLNRLNIKPQIETAIYTPGAILWNIDRKHQTRGSMVKIIGTDLYGKLTVRNVNTVRKLQELIDAT